MIPPLNLDTGLLPPGVHACSLREAEAAFGSHNATRRARWNCLLSCLDEMRVAGLRGALHIDGSFTTDKEHPGDVEVTLDVRGQPDTTAGLAVVFYTRRHHPLKSLLAIDWYPTLSDNSDFTLFFQYVGPKTAQAKNLQEKDAKGILRIDTW